MVAAMGFTRARGSNNTVSPPLNGLAMPQRTIVLSVLLVGLTLGLGCAGSADRLKVPRVPKVPKVPIVAASSSPVTLVGAGDIARCSTDGAAATARLLDSFPNAVIFTAGDNAYSQGTSAEFRKCYAPTWGRFKARTWPAIGNHEYQTPGASGYFTYFGERAGPENRGFYSYTLGAWHVIALNSSVDMQPGSAQEQWLRADLKANPRRCTLAYWHTPRFSSGPHGNTVGTQPLWEALYEAGADVIIGGHDHIYERFAPQTPAGKPDSVRGIRQFVVGTGGASHYGLGARQPNSEVFDSTAFGILKLTLDTASYAWEFIPVAGQRFRDAGTGVCH